MKTFPIAFIILISLLHITFSSAQSVSGRVTDSLSRQPLELVTVSLANLNGKPFKVTYTHTDGAFAFDHIPANTYLLTTSFVGYRPGRARITVKASVRLTLLLAPESNVLHEISVKATKPLIRREADRIIYDLQADPDSKGMNMLEMMRKVPFLTVDANENLLLKGNSDYKIFVNDKPSGLVANNPKAVLKSMPASTIERIEVITQPSAKYDAEGYAGIINIITKKNSKNGYTGSLNINGSMPAGGAGMGGSIAAKVGSLGISAWAGGNLNHSPETNFLYERHTFDDTPTMLRQDGTSNSDGRSGYFGTELSYDIDSLNLLTGQFGMYGNENNGNERRSSILTAQAGVIQQYTLLDDSENGGAGYDAGLNYQRNFKDNKKRILTFSYRFVRSANRQFNHIENNNLLTGAFTSTEQHNKGFVNEHTVQADYVHPFKKLYTEWGIKGIFRKNGSNYRYEDTADRYINDQQIFAAYHSSRIALKSWNLSAGLRLEHTQTDIGFSATDVPVQQNYFNLVPSVSANKNFRDGASLNFGFSQRIKRPGIKRLNPFVDRSNPNYEISGNPNLRSSVINSLMLGFGSQKKLSLNIGVNYVFLKNLELQIYNFDQATHIIRVTYENLGRGSGLSIDFNAGYPVTDRLKVSMNGNVTYAMLEGTSDGVLIKANRLSENIFASAAYNTNTGWRINTNFQYNGRNQVSLQGVNNPLLSASLGINKDVVKDKLSFNASVNNPFSKFRQNRIYTNGNNFSETSAAQQYFRSFRLSLNYSFGKLKEQIRKNQRGIKNDDLSN